MSIVRIAALILIAGTIAAQQPPAQPAQPAPVPPVLENYKPVTAERLKKPEDGDWLMVRRTYDAFGPDRMIWGGLGMNMPAFEKNLAMFEEMFAFASETDRAKIRGLNALKVFGFKTA